MKEQIKKLWQQYREIITYVLFGGFTTVVNLIVFYVFSGILGERLYLVTNTIAWLFAVIFAYVTNKLWVFESKSWKASVLAKEIPSFLGARVASLLIEQAGLFLLVDVMDFGSLSFTLLGFDISGSMIAKLILQVIVVILNYIFSKFIIFRKKKEPKEQNNR